MKYEVLDGVHIQGNKVYQKGDVVETNIPLTKLFPNKFREVVPKSTSSLKTGTTSPTAKSGEKPGEKKS